MRLLHYSEKPLTRLRRKPVVQRDVMGSYTKPRGLWVTPEGDEWGWMEWCGSERFRVDDWKHETDIFLTKNNNVLHLTTPLEMVAFDCEYKEDFSYKEESYVYQRINWQRVASEYDGLIISPYQWKHRLNMDWYYGWDCASGCIWNPKVLKLGACRPYELKVEEINEDTGEKVA